VLLLHATQFWGCHDVCLSENGGCGCPKCAKKHGKNCTVLFVKMDEFHMMVMMSEMMATTMIVWCQHLRLACCSFWSAGIDKRCRHQHSHSMCTLCAPSEWMAFPALERFMEQGTLRALVSNGHATHLKTLLHTAGHAASSHECRLLRDAQIVLQIMNVFCQTLLQRLGCHDWR